ncbi:cell division protein FtsB [Pelistega indica]|uniref:Cell division protein FtsB n=1 Tax=Pelistega indica TaxID=1414851 RepID=V8G2D1_9BURK|nr:cell division protein FtsB [Pelistega indica]ETD70580.1 cell division protein FtsB [Pelistega indica]
MKLILLVLVIACIAIQYPLRLGASGYKRVDELNQQLQAQRETNKAMTARNNAMQAEIEDLKSGTQALEDYARSEMSMVASNEVFVRVLPPNEEVPVAPIRIGAQEAQKEAKPVAPVPTTSTTDASKTKDPNNANNAKPVTQPKLRTQ